MKNRVVLIIPYFGKLPNYFNLWRKSAENNPDFDFMFFTDVDIPEGKNIKIIKYEFPDLVKRIQDKLNMKITLSSPYKLCDYRPAYGYLFEEEIKNYDFWGFCDIDLIFGNLTHFISDELLDNNDKLFFLGHFCLIRNDDRMRTLFYKEYPNVIDYKYAFTTKYSCHFDENGTIAWAPDFDKTIRFYSDWCFGDPNWMEYQFFDAKHIEYGGVYKDGKLYLRYKNGKTAEAMYLHLQKRAMKLSECGDSFAILRDRFIGSLNEFYDLINTTPPTEEIESFYKQKKIQRGSVFKRISNGALKNAIYMKKNKIITK